MPVGLLAGSVSPDKLCFRFHVYATPPTAPPRCVPRDAARRKSRAPERAPALSVARHSRLVACGSALKVASLHVHTNLHDDAEGGTHPARTLPIMEEYQQHCIPSTRQQGWLTSLLSIRAELQDFLKRVPFAHFAHNHSPRVACTHAH